MKKAQWSNKFFWISKQKDYAISTQLSEFLSLICRHKVYMNSYFTDQYCEAI